VALVGNLTRDPELRFAATGTAWATCGMAVNRQRRCDDGTWEELLTEFFDVVCFGALAEHVADSLATGDRVIAYGRIEHQDWTSRDGAKHATQRLVAEEVGASLRFTIVEIPGAASTGRLVLDDDEAPF
jgi:single-strand DNA-binding protein